MDESGYSIVKNVIPHRIPELIKEFSRLAASAERGCVRHVFPHSTLIRELACSQELLTLIPTGHLPVRCILFDKTPANNWPVAWHQDLTIAVKQKAKVAGFNNWSAKEGVPHVQPPASLLENMITLRLHLDDTPSENGALQVIPGSHLLGKISADSSARDTTPTTCECKRGDVLIMKPLILHSSARSKEPAHRRIIHIEYADRSLLPAALDWYEDLN